MARTVNDLYIISVTKTEKLLVDLCDNPHDFTYFKEIKKFLKNQNLFSRMELSEESILPMSLNTMKGVADTYVDGGWERLNSLRKTALYLVARQSESKVTQNKTTKVGLTQSLKTVEDKLLKAHQANLVLLQLINELTIDFGDIADLSSDPNLVGFSQEFRAKIYAILALNSAPYNKL